VVLLLVANLYPGINSVWAAESTATDKRSKIIIASVTAALSVISNGPIKHHASHSKLAF
jgi:hypothetical protein